MWRTIRRYRRLLSLSLILLLAWPVASQAAPMPYPGLPEPTIEPGNWMWVRQIGMSETVKAKQHVAVPPLTLAAYGGSLPTGGDPAPGEPYHMLTGGDAAFVSPPGSPEPYGYMPPIRVRTVGFGLLPAEATIQISQRRRGDGSIVPIHAEVNYFMMPDKTRTLPDTVIEDAFEVRVIQVKLDGVDVGISGNCRTVRPAPVTMIGPGYTAPGEHNQSNEDLMAYLDSLDVESYFDPVFGGQLTGTIEIPPFTGCTTQSGDDLSAMLTLSASGPGNRVVARARAACALESNFNLPPAPGDYDKFPFPEEGYDNPPWCREYEPNELIPYPERSDS
ncbi:hypothetical protein RB608_08470 [Nocardioides sp. LHD-245]|uniref:hypothetical protein n=1 Tax=Nocardioides sp. LHD-245 TaxID=3051387 RepID=UPI0027E1E152|nr:hypothetical protein [Nocardioides sp. LHD-245]